MSPDHRRRPGEVQARASPALRCHPRLSLARRRYRWSRHADLGPDVRLGHLHLWGLGGGQLEPGVPLRGEGGTCVVTAVAPPAQKQADLNLFLLAMMNKEIKGCLYGAESPRTQIPRLLSLYRDGILKLDELITETYTLDQVNQGYADMRAGRILRGVIAF